MYARHEHCLTGGSGFRWVVVQEFIQSADVSRGRNGFRKDKGGEKLAESEEDLLEHRTDAFDTLYIGAEKFPYREAFSISTSGIL